MRRKLSAEEFIEWFVSQAVEDKNGCWNWPHATSHGGTGYGRVTWNYVEYHTHVLSYRLFVGELTPGLLVCHSCDNKQCYNPEHLWEGTQVDNIQDSVSKGRWTHTRGTNAKLTSAEVLEIVQLREAGWEYKALMARFNITAGPLHGILHGITWSHITGIPRR